MSYTVHMGRRLAGWMAGLGVLGASVGATLWSFVDPTTGGASYWVHLVGVFIIGLSGLVAVQAVYKVRITKVPRTLMGRQEGLS